MQTTPVAGLQHRMAGPPGWVLSFPPPTLSVSVPVQAQLGDARDIGLSECGGA